MEFLRLLDFNEYLINVKITGRQSATSATHHYHYHYYYDYYYY